MQDGRLRHSGALSSSEYSWFIQSFLYLCVCFFFFCFVFYENCSKFLKFTALSYKIYYELKKKKEKKRTKK